MSYLPRKLDLHKLLSQKSFFLFGPRATGKSSLVRQQLENRALVIDLLRSELYLRLSAHPEDLEGLIAAAVMPRSVVIDEIQRVPALLPEVHRLIEEKRHRFLLTGSSARTLRRGATDLLAGRAWIAELFPLSWSEIPAFDLGRYLRFGGLPSVYLSRAPQEELRAYVSVYVQEEIRAEGIIRRLPPFTRFLRVAALSSGQLLNYAQNPAAHATVCILDRPAFLLGFVHGRKNLVDSQAADDVLLSEKLCFFHLHLLRLKLLHNKRFESDGAFSSTRPPTAALEL